MRLKLHSLLHLADLGVSVVSQYREPGSNRLVDLFLPQVPRSVIEIKGISYDNTRAETLLERLLDEARQRRNMHVHLDDGGYPYYTIIVPCGHEIPGFTQLTSKIDYIFVSTPIHSDESVQIAALEIVDFLSSERVKMGLPPHEKQIAETKDQQKSAQPHVTPKKHEEIERTCQALLKTFQDLVPIEQRDVLQHEFQELLNEHEGGHFTSCALRAGRCLEHIVYAVATGWDVKVEEFTLNSINEITQHNIR